MPGEGGARSQGLISSHHGLAVKGVTFPSAGCPRWKRLPWTGNRLGACLPGRLGRVGGLVHLPGLLGWARLSSRLQGPGRAVLTHLHPGLLHDQLHDLPHGLHLRPFQDHRGPPHRHVGPRGTGPGLGKGTLGRGAVCREPQLRQRRSWQGAAPGAALATRNLGSVTRVAHAEEVTAPTPSTSGGSAGSTQEAETWDLSSACWKVASSPPSVQTGSFPAAAPPTSTLPAHRCSPFFPTGIKHELQANCYEEVKDRCTLAEKLGGSAVISLEGKPL